MLSLSRKKWVRSTRRDCNGIWRCSPLGGAAREALKGRAVTEDSAMLRGLSEPVRFVRVGAAQAIAVRDRLSRDVHFISGLP